MNDLQITNKNGDLNTTLDMLDVISKKGPREFLTRMGELRVREDELQANCYIAELDLRKEEEKTNQIRIKEEGKTNRVRIKAQRDVLIEMEKTERVRIKENSKCFQKLLEVSQAAYNRKIDFYESILKFCKEDISPRILAFDQEISSLEKEHKSNAKNQEAHMSVWRLLNQKRKEKEALTDKYNKIVSSLITASDNAKLELGNTFGGYIK